jgi:outer membrane biosynthesis protein TonB
VIVGSLPLILVAAVLLAYGLMHGSNPHLVGSVAASLLAAVALVAGGRQAARAVAVESEPAEELAAASEPVALGEPVAPSEPVAPGEPAVPSEPAEDEPAPEPVAGPVAEPVAEPVDPRVVAHDDDYDEDEEPPDEPPPQRLSAADAALVARMDDEVLVIDGRPRYHGEACPHLVGQQIEPLPVSEAVRFGFTPCSRCEPASELLARVRRA